MSSFEPIGVRGKCPNCGAPLLPNASSCSHCGVVLARDEGTDDFDAIFPNASEQGGAAGRTDAGRTARGRAGSPITSSLENLAPRPPDVSTNGELQTSIPTEPAMAPRPPSGRGGSSAAPEPAFTPPDDARITQRRVARTEPTNQSAVTSVRPAPVSVPPSSHQPTRADQPRTPLHRSAEQPRHAGQAWKFVTVGIAIVIGLFAIAHLLPSTNSVRTVDERPAPARPVPPTQGRTEPVAPVTGDDLAANVARATESSILRTLNLAANGPKGEVESAALAAGRDHDFSGIAISRDRKRARPLNEAALDAFHREKDFDKAYRLQKDAFTADSLDIEIAGNLAIYAFRLDKIDEARTFVLYALGLPRVSTKTGRTADWATLAAIYARSGDAVNAQNALFVTLAMSSNVPKRCEVAISSVNDTYGPVLRQATEAMFVRIRDQGLADAPECALPIQWQ